jgi:hypothetical protein
MCWCVASIQFFICLDKFGDEKDKLLDDVDVLICFNSVIDLGR